MGPEQAAKACELLAVKQVVPMHCGTFPALTGTRRRLLELIEREGRTGCSRCGRRGELPDGERPVSSPQQKHGGVQPGAGGDVVLLRRTCFSCRRVFVVQGGTLTMAISRRSVLKLPLVFAMTQTNLNELPANLPRPKDDGGARHLKGLPLPDLDLPSTVRPQRQPREGQGATHRHLRVSDDRPARSAASPGLGRHPGRARLHAGDLRLPRSSQGSRASCTPRCSAISTQSTRTTSRRW